MFAVVQLHTSGLHPAVGHRVTGIAVQQLCAKGTRQARFHTAIAADPGAPRFARSGPTPPDSPLFEDIANRVVTLLKDRVFVGHNTTWLQAFLASEYLRLDTALPLTTKTTVCTLQAAAAAWPTASRSLTSCAAAADVPLPAHPTVMAECDAVGQMLTRLLDQRPDTVVLPTPAVRLANHWPRMPASTRHWKATTNRPTKPAHPRRSQWVDQLPAAPYRPNVLRYLGVVDHAVKYSKMASRDSQALADAAGSCGLTSGDQHHLHEQYVAAIVAVAQQSGHIDVDAFIDVRCIATLLGVAAPQGADLAKGGVSVCTPSHAALLLPGGACLAIAQDTPADHRLAQAAEQAGFRVRHSVSPDVDMLITMRQITNPVDVHSARERGIPTATAAELTRALTLL